MNKIPYTGDDMFEVQGKFTFDGFCKNLLEQESIFGVEEDYILIPNDEHIVDNVKEAVYSLSSKIPKSSLYKKLYKFSRKTIDVNIVEVSVIYRV